MSYSELAKRLHVSEITIRRDLNALQSEGLVEKVVGGGKVARSAEEPTFLSKRALYQVEKQNIAKLALTLVEPGMTVGLSAGTTTWTLAKAIRGFSDLTFVTNSTNIALELKSNGYSDIFLTGGQFRTPSDALVGPIAEAAVRKLHTDILFLGVHGIDLTYGFSTPNLLEASVNRAFMERTERVVLVFDHSKWGIRALAHIADIDEVDIIVTDDGGPGFNLDAVQEKGVRLLVASRSDLRESESTQCHR
jgi:DeoR/GlpR family transcriptional regulator of sugar metabolism